MATHHHSYISTDLVVEVDHVRSGGGSSSQHQKLRSAVREREGEERRGKEGGRKGGRGGRKGEGGRWREGGERREDRRKNS